jgi:hypothetical protein
MKKRVPPELLEIAQAWTRLDDEYVVLGQRLVAFDDSRAWEDAGFASFKEATEAAGLAHRKTCYIMSIARKMREYRVSRSQISGVGWSAMKEVVLAFGPDRDKNMKLIARARSATVEELKLEIRGVRQDVVQVVVALTPAEKAAYEKALANRNGGVMPRGLRPKGKVLSALVKDWSKTRKTSKKVA